MPCSPENQEPQECKEALLVDTLLYQALRVFPIGEYMGWVFSWLFQICKRRELEQDITPSRCQQLYDLHPGNGIKCAAVQISWSHSGLPDLHSFWAMSLKIGNISSFWNDNLKLYGTVKHLSLCLHMYTKTLFKYKYFAYQTINIYTYEVVSCNNIYRI